MSAVKRALRDRAWMAVLAVLIGLPLAMLLDRSPDPVELPYGWQMYSVGERQAVVSCEGQLVSIRRDEWVRGACDGD